ncbi:Ribonuclease H [Bienertia sinuspersici]
MGGKQAKLIATKFGFGGHMSETVHISHIDQNMQHLTMEICRNGEEPWYFTAIYASPDPVKRIDLWKYLQDFAKTHNHPWLLGGDWNDTRYDWERSSSCDEVKRHSRHFNSWIEDMELLETEFSRPSHTWARGHSSETRKKWCETNIVMDGVILTCISKLPTVRIFGGE